MEKYIENLKNISGPIMPSQIPATDFTLKEMLEQLKKSREHAEQGLCKEADDVVKDMRDKHKL